MHGFPSEANDLKPKLIQKKTVAELLKLDMKHSDSQLKDSELEIGLPTRQALNDVKTVGCRSSAILVLGNSSQKL